VLVDQRRPHAGRGQCELAELYMSRRTAQTHVSRVLRKLDVSSRMDLIRSVHRTE
jgi:DNA-binding CsgD family transcriptional regulator